MPVKYFTPGALMRVVKGDGELIPGEEQPSTDAAWIGRVGRNIDDGSLADFGMFRHQVLLFANGETKAFRGWQLEYVTEDELTGNAEKVIREDETRD